MGLACLDAVVLKLDADWGHEESYTLGGADSVAQQLSPAACTPCPTLPQFDVCRSCCCAPARLSWPDFCLLALCLAAQPPDSHASGAPGGAKHNCADARDLAPTWLRYPARCALRAVLDRQRHRRLRRASVRARPPMARPAQVRSPWLKAPPARLAAGVLQMCTINADVTGTCAPACSVQCSVRGPQRARLVPARACSGVEGIERWTREGGGNAALIGATLLALGMLTPHFSSAFFPG